MPVRGSLDADAIAVAKITLDFLQQTPKIHALAAVVNTRTGKTMAWTEGEGGVWSKGTLTKLRELRELMEEDLSRALCTDAPTARAPGVRVEDQGLGEFLGDGPPEVPSI